MRGLWLGKEHVNTISTTKLIALTAIFGVLTFACGLIRIPVGPVPVTLQTMAVLLSGLLLKPFDAFLAMILHLVLKLVLSGEFSLISPSFGFVIAFVAAAPFLSFLTQKKEGSPKYMIIHILIATMLIYAIGLPYMAIILRFYLDKKIAVCQFLTMGMLVFLPGDLLKAAAAWFLATRLRPILSRVLSTEKKRNS